MALFDYVGRDASGKEVKGSLNANSREGVAEQLMKDNIIPITITASTRHKMSIWEVDLLGGRAKTEDMTAFCRQMYTMIRVGIPVVDALTNIADTTHCQVFKKIIPQIVESISSGSSLSDSLRKHPKHFPMVFINIIAAGEASGQLEKSFLQLAEHLQKESTISKKIKSALRYPIMVIVTICIAIGIINFMVIPTFVSMFENFNAELPWATQLLMDTSNFMLNHWQLLLIAIIALIIGFKVALRIPQYRYHWDHMMLHLPIFGKILHNAMMSRFGSMFAMMLETGIPLIQGLELVANTLGNRYATHHILKMRQTIERGELLSLAARESKLFSPLVLQMIAIGEDTGSIDSLLAEVANYYSEEVDYDLNRIGDLIEPIMMVIMGGMVLILAVGIFLPMWSTVSFIK